MAKKMCLKLAISWIAKFGAENHLTQTAAMRLKHVLRPTCVALVLLAGNLPAGR